MPGTFHNLRIKQDLATALLLDQGRLISNVRTPQSYLLKLETAINEYKATIKAVIAVLEEEDDKKAYTDTLTLQLANLYPILDKLHEAVDKFDSDAEDETPVRTDKNNRVLSYMKMKIQAAVSVPNTK